MENKISISDPIPEEVIQQALEGVQTSYNTLMPYLSALTPADRKQMLKMSDGTEPFVSKSIEYMGSYPNLVPSYVNVDDVESSLTTYDVLSPLFMLLSTYSSLVSDTRMAAGGNAYAPTLSFYQSVKVAAKSRIPNAKIVFEELKKRFAKKRKGEEPVPEVVKVA